MKITYRSHAVDSMTEQTYFIFALRGAGPHGFYPRGTPLARYKLSPGYID